VVADLTTGVCAVLDLCDLHGPTCFKMLGNSLKVNLVVCKKKRQHYGSTTIIAC